MPEPEVPQEGAYLWEWFWELSNARSSSGFGQNPLSWQEIKAWSDLYRLELGGDELTAIRAMDNAFMAAREEEYIVNG